MRVLGKGGELIEVLKGTHDGLHPKFAFETLCLVCAANQDGDLEILPVRVGEQSLQDRASDVP